MGKAATAAATAALNVSEPLRSTETYKTIAAEIVEALDEAGTNVRYGGYVEKEDRRRRREKRLERAGKEGGLGKRRERTEINLE